MPIQQTYYLNGPDLASATCVFSDALLTICAPDGYYSDGVISREQVSCVLLPQQQCEDCCVETCSKWRFSEIVGAYTIGYYPCETGVYTEDIFPGGINEFCLVRGTTPVLISGDCDIQKIQDCGCCSDSCNTYIFATAPGEWASFAYTDCSGTRTAFSIFDTNSYACVKANTPIEIMTGVGTITFAYCGC